MNSITKLKGTEKERTNEVTLENIILTGYFNKAIGKKN